MYKAEVTAFLEWAGKLAQDVHNDEPYTIAGMLLLAMGGWFYLRSPWLWQRALALFAGRTLAMAIAATGKAIIYSSSGWPHFAYLFTWQTEAMSTVIVWGWLVMGFCTNPAEPFAASR